MRNAEPAAGFGNDAGEAGVVVGEAVGDAGDSAGADDWNERTRFICILPEPGTESPLDTQEVAETRTRSETDGKPVDDSARSPTSDCSRCNMHELWIPSSAPVRMWAHRCKALRENVKDAIFGDARRPRVARRTSANRPKQRIICETFSAFFAVLSLFC